MILHLAQTLNLTPNSAVALTLTLTLTLILAPDLALALDPALAQATNYNRRGFRDNKPCPLLGFGLGLWLGLGLALALAFIHALEAMHALKANRAPCAYIREAGAA